MKGTEATGCISLRTRYALHEVPIEQYPSTYTHCLHSTASCFQLRRQTWESYVGVPQDRSLSPRHLGCLALIKPFNFLCLLVSWSSSPVVLLFIHTPWQVASSLGILFSSITVTFAGWLGQLHRAMLLLGSQIVISRWFELPCSLVRDSGRESRKLFYCVCLEPKRELTSLVLYLLQSV